jgi:hypothetical protein
MITFTVTAKIGDAAHTFEVRPLLCVLLMADLVPLD